jgi:uncharacterized membrane protein
VFAWLGSVVVDVGEVNCNFKQGPSIERAALIVSIVYASILFATAAFQHYLFGTQVWDIGLFEQFSWLIGEGRLTAISSLRQVAPLEDHFSLLLLPLGAVYKLFPSTFTLIGLQSIALGSLPAVAAYVAVQRQVKARLIWALICAIVLCPYSFLVNRGDFHPDVLTIPFMIVAIFEATRSGRWRYYFCLFITLFAKNAQALFGLGLGLYAIAKGRYSRGLITIVISIFWWFLATHLSAAGGDHVAIRLGYLGDTKLEMIATLLVRPWIVFSVASPSDIFLYTLGLSLPFVALLRKPVMACLLGAAPVYLVNIISDSGIQRELNHHYSIPILAFLIAGCLDSMPLISVKAGQIQKNVFNVTLVLSLVAFLGYSRLMYFKSRYLPRLPEAIAFQSVVSGIGAQESVLASSNYVVHLAGRERISQIEKNDYQEKWPFDVIIFPSEKALINVRGRLREVGKTKVGRKMNKVLTRAKATGMSCDQVNDYIRLCRKEAG